MLQEQGARISFRGVRVSRLHSLSQNNTKCNSCRETDLDEVLQTDQVFSNVSKGALAPKADLQKAFGADSSTADIVREILQKGELQVGEKERSAKLDQLHAEVISIVSAKCVDPGSKRVYTATMIEKALAELATTPAGGWHGVRDGKSAKAQALEAIKALVAAQIIPIARARMRLKITGNKNCKEKVMGHVETVEVEEFLAGGSWECTGFVEPGKYKLLVDIVGSETKGRGRVEILDTAVGFPHVVHAKHLLTPRDRLFTKRI